MAVATLVRGASNGENQAWDALIERYTPLIWSICRRHQLAGADAEDICQTVWLQLATHLGEIRDPDALAGWIATTTRRQCGRTLRAPKGPAGARGQGLGGHRGRRAAAPFCLPPPRRRRRW